MNERFVKILLLASLFIIPLLGSYQDFGYEKIKVIFFIASVSVAGLVWLLSRPKLKWDLIKISSLVFILTLFTSSSLGVDQRLSFLGKDPYFQGLALYADLFLLSLLVDAVRIKLTEVSLTLAASAVMVSLIAIKDWMLLNLFISSVPTYAGRVVSTFGQPNFYAGFLLLTLPFSYLLFNSPNRKLQVLGGAGGLLVTVGILVSYSRSAILLAFLLLLLGLTDQLKNRLKISLAVLGTVLLSVFIAWQFSSGIVGNEVSQPLQTKNPDLTKESVEKRAYIWPAAWQLVLQRPFLGYGLENIGISFADYFQKNKHAIFEENLNISPVLISLKELNIDRSHNYLLDLLLFSGAAGLTVWILMIALLFGKLKQNSSSRHRFVLLVSLAVYLIWVQFQNQSVIQLIYFWLLTGLID